MLIVVRKYSCMIQVIASVCLEFLSQYLFIVFIDPFYI